MDSENTHTHTHTHTHTCPFQLKTGNITPNTHIETAYEKKHAIINELATTYITHGLSLYKKLVIRNRGFR